MAYKKTQRNKNGLTAKQQKAMDKIIARFENGDLSTVVKKSLITVDKSSPAHNRSLNNRILSIAQADTIDLRTYKQWQAVGRQVRKGEMSNIIYVPRMIKAQDEDGNEQYRCVGFSLLSVFSPHQTDEIEGFEGEKYQPVETTPEQLPPLYDISQKMGISVKWVEGEALPGAYGSMTTNGRNMTLATQDVQTFFHELAHSIHSQIEELKGGQDTYQETIAEFTACVLMDVYGLGDRTGNAWKYIKMYTPDPVKAVKEALGTIEKVFGVLNEVMA